MGLRFKKGGNHNKILKVFIEILKDSANTYKYKHKELYSIMREKAGVSTSNSNTHTIKVLKNLYQKDKTQITNTGEINPKWERMVQWKPKK